MMHVARPVCRTALQCSSTLNRLALGNRLGPGMKLAATALTTNGSESLATDTVTLSAPETLSENTDNTGILAPKAQCIRARRLKRGCIWQKLLVSERTNAPLPSLQNTTRLTANAPLRKVGLSIGRGGSIRAHQQSRGRIRPRGALRGGHRPAPTKRETIRPQELENARGAAPGTQESCRRGRQEAGDRASPYMDRPRRLPLADPPGRMRRLRAIASKNPRSG